MIKCREFEETIKTLCVDSFLKGLLIFHPLMIFVGIGCLPTDFIGTMTSENSNGNTIFCRVYSRLSAAVRVILHSEFHTNVL